MGIIMGPALGFINDMAVINVLSEIGIAFLLFIVGIELDISRLRNIGAIASFGSIMQMALMFAAGFGAMLILGHTSMIALYAGIVMMFSSTMVVIKLLSDKSELDTLHGRIAIGFLLMQDIVAVLILSTLTTLNDFSIIALIFSIFKGMLALFVALFFSNFLFPKLFKFAAKSYELFFLLSLSICFAFSLLFFKIGFSIAIGAFVAGITLGNLPYNIEIVGRVKSLRDFFSTLFFVSIGAKLTFDTMTVFATPLFVLFLIAVVLLPIITTLIGMFFGYSKKTSFIVGLALAQVSEFGLIAVDQGVNLGHIPQSFLSLTIILALLTMISSAYYINFSEKIYLFFRPILKPIEKLSKVNNKYEFYDAKKTHNVILVGYDRIGYSIYKTLKRMKKDTMIVDLNPDVIKKLIKRKIPCIYGDLGDIEILEKLHLHNVNLVISTTPDFQSNLLLLKMMKEDHAHAKIIVTSYHIHEALTLYDNGADYVIVPHLLGGDHASILLENVSEDLDKLITTKLEHIKDLKHRQRY